MPLGWNGRWLALWIGLLAACAMPGAAGEPNAGDTSDARPRFTAETEVVASRIASDPADAGRREVVLEREEIAALPVQTLQDVLALIPGVGLSRRGARGVQGDLNLRGSSFEQALVMVNGVRVNNPQTGHHHLDLFLPAAAIERVEVLYGSGAAVHGPDAFGGAINIVTAPPATAAFVRGGDFGLAGGGIAGSFGPGLWASLEREAHSGYRDNTDADVGLFAGGWSWQGEASSVDVAVSAGRREFGAQGFYSSLYPDQREATDGELLTVRGDTPAWGSEVRFTGSLRASSHRDDFILDRERPEWFRNRHRTDGLLVQASLRDGASALRWAVGAEGAREELESSNLGDRHLVRTAVFGELGGTVGVVRLSLQGRVDHQDPWGSEATWGVGGSWPIDRRWRVRGHLGTSFRVPSFTDLYYTSPTTLGDPGLEPERGLSGELGLDWRGASVTVFERTADPIIDYLLGEDGIWRAANAGRVTTRGLELACRLPAAGRLRWQRLSAVWLDSEIEVDPAGSAYALAHPELEAAWTGTVEAGRGWSSGWTVRYRLPRDQDPWATVDLRIARRLPRALDLVLEASNLLDAEIAELHAVPLPGRWLSLTVSWRPSTR